MPIAQLTPVCFDPADDHDPLSLRLVTSRNPAEVSFYLGLATVIATFSGAAVALGLLQCIRWGDRVIAVGVLLGATLGIAAALATVARGHTSAASNILISIGVAMVAAWVLIRALRIIFTAHESSLLPRTIRRSSSLSTQDLPVIWNGRWIDRSELNGKRNATSESLSRWFWSTAMVFVTVIALAIVLVFPDLFDGFLRSRPVGTALSQRISTTCTLTLPRLSRLDIGVSGLHGKRFVVPLNSPNNFIVPIGVTGRRGNNDNIARKATAAFALLRPPNELMSKYNDFVTGWQSLATALNNAETRTIRDPIARIRKNGAMVFSKATLRGFRHYFTLIRQALRRIDAASLSLNADRCYSANQRSLLSVG